MAIKLVLIHFFFTNVPAAAFLSTYIIIFNLTITYAIWKYEMFALTPMTAAESIVATMSDALFLVNPDGSVQSGNRAARLLLDYDEGMLGRTHVRALFADGVDMPVWIANGESSEQDANVKYLETWFATRDRSRIPVSLASSVLIDSNDNMLGYLIIARDITERKRMDDELAQHREHLEQLVSQRTDALAQSQEQLRLLGERVSQAKEEESARISRELHDELGQVLTSIKIDVALHKKRLSARGWTDDTGEKSRIDGIHTRVDGAIRTVQNITKKLRPTMLDEIGLVATIDWMVQDWQERTGVECAFTAQVTTEDLDPDLSTAVYRIVQESLTNVARHAKADKAAVEMTETDDVLTVAVKDNGIGISEAQKADFNAVGLLGMTERARPYNGKVIISGTPGEGTDVRLTIPRPRERGCWKKG